MASSAKQVKFRLTDVEHAEIDVARGSLSIPEFCKQQVLRSVRTRVVRSADARASVKPIPKGRG